MSCQVSVLYFARSAELAGLRCETLRVPRQVTSLQLWEEIVRVHPSVVPITEASVIIAVSSPHRAESLEAVAYCINTLKASVPIWKKEIYEDEYSWKENKECFWANSKK
ncbi:molybdopterin synthase catalytic subunit isoform X6 [Rissa tridactyla]|uniref:molybdopterin synthase catalytic subunit isoform X6 n=1 Tax=Rissa tridactyla TaxID=75485 RepID=UPI0023BAD8ED|nr:molybdopterin synthase catalytic subunit isoform X6 [Rissa tridactyla]